jgi:DNA polymerase III sliding clamp (beta) subunit (PCNA family)
LQLHSNAVDVGKVEDAVKCESVGDFEEFQIAFNGQYLLQMLGTAEGENVTLGLNTELGSATITDGAESYKYILMPMQVQ